MLPESLAGLCLPALDPGCTRAVLAARTRATVADYLALPVPAHRAAIVAAVRATASRNPSALAAACATPTVGGMVGAARRERDPAARDHHLRRADALVALELGARGALHETVRVESLDPAPLPCLGARLAFRAVGGTLVVRADGPTDGDGRPLEAEPAAVPLRVGQLALVDTNPLQAIAAHPDRAGNAVDLGGAPVEAWQTALDAALDLVLEVRPDLGDELRLGLRTIVPVGRHEERHDSVSFRDSVGAVYLTLHPQVLPLAEAILHEFQHNKLNAAMRFDRVLENEEGAAYASPLRPDPRPMLGVLMAVHAFVAVEALHDALRARGHALAKGRDFEAHAADVRRANDEALATVRAAARTTPRGRTLVDGLARLLPRGRGAEATQSS